MKNNSLVKIKKYLENHEGDIADGVNDFNDLKYVFRDLMERDPIGTAPKRVIYPYGHYPGPDA